METRDGVVQRKLNGSSTVVAQYLEVKLIFAIFLFILGCVFLVFPIHVHAQQQSSSSLTPEQMANLVAKYCSDQPNAKSIRNFGNSDSKYLTGCADSAGNLLGDYFDAIKMIYLQADSGTGFIYADDAKFQAAFGTTQDLTCSITNLDFKACLFNPLISFLASLIMSLAGMALTVAGSLFDLFINSTVINFRGTLEKIGMLDTVSASGAVIIGPITLIWAKFRDIANILIIGMFVFMAISTILSLESYGYRKYLAKILVVAVLINFSMFFGKITIDVSNFVAREFYKAIPVLNVAGTNASDTVTATTDLTAPVGISGTFMNDIGISGVWDWKYDQLSELTTKQGPLIMLSYSLGAALFMTTTALILLYGSFLLASRAILLVFLLLTSSLAFASMLLPGKFAEEAWGKWWTALINSAVFAPLLMLFLAATLLVLNGAANVRGESTLAAFLHDPTNVDGWAVLFTFIVASGMLFVSIKVANTFAGKIAGFNYAAAIPALAGSVGLGAMGFAGRNTVGRLGAAREEAAKKRAQKEYDESKARTGVGTISDSTMRSMKMWGGISKQSFDARNLKPVQGAIKQSALAKIAGGTPFVSKEAVKGLTEGGKNGYAQEKEAVQKRLATEMEEKQKIAAKAETADAEKMAKIQSEAELENAQRDHTAAASTNVTTATLASDRRSEANALKVVKDAEIATHETTQQGHKDQISRIESDIRAKQQEARNIPASDPLKKAYVENQLKVLGESRDGERTALGNVEKLIATARKEASDAEDRARQAATNNKEAAQSLKEAIKTQSTAAERAAEKPKINAGEAAQAATQSLQKSADKGLGRDLFSIPSTIQQNFYNISNEDLAKSITKNLKSKEQKDKVRDLLSDDDRKDIAKEAADAAKKAGETH